MATVSARPIPGQRWVSDTEPELGLGILMKEEFGRVEMFFPAAAEHRQYALSSAPLRRVRFEVGDRIRTHEGSEYVVEGVAESAGLLVYHTEEREIAEAELSDSISFSKPEDRLLGGQIDDLAVYDLRVEALRRRSAIRKSPVRGFVGGRVDRLPHQLYIAGEVASRLAPRVLLADEVGLGKTIEAGLILHRLHLTGRADRVLILLPEPLIHQWFVEMLRRFNLLFSIFDEERCVSIEANDPGANPFLDSQFVISSTAFLAADPRRADQSVEAPWDLVIVDEAHHLRWGLENASPEYELVDRLAGCVSGLLLLTATPQQLGPEGHFARLRLLDSDRYASLEQFLAESTDYANVAQAVDGLLAGKALTKKDLKLFGERSARVAEHAKALAAGDEHARGTLVSELLDAFGTGRVLFRNTRAAMKGFPERRANLVEVPPGESMERRISWLIELLVELGEEKVLLICRSRELAEAIHERLQSEIPVKIGLFHEGLSLLQRDRNAAYFAEPEGARVLICSEIGSEGRNFQFAHHLVLFDLPRDPELLEQRIGRLDRIGQTSAITIHVPFQAGTESEVLARWYHEGLNAFEQSLHGATEIARGFSGDVDALVVKSSPAKLRKLIEATRKRRDVVTGKLAEGYDRLLELSSCRAEQAAETIRLIGEADADESFEQFVLVLLDHFGLHIEELGARTYLFQPGHLITDSLPALPDEGLSVTFDRAKALGRDDIGFMSFDHPMVRGAIDLLLGSESGNSSFGVWITAGPEAVLLEVNAVVECVAPASLHSDRFLPATPIRALVNHSLKDLSADGALPGFAGAKLTKGNIYNLLEKAPVRRDLLPAMIKAAEQIVDRRMAAIVGEALEAMRKRLQGEIDRLIDLQTINDHVRPEEIEALKRQKLDLEAALGGSRLRMDAVRLVWKKGG